MTLLTNAQDAYNNYRTNVYDYIQLRQQVLLLASLRRRRRIGVCSKSSTGEAIRAMLHNDTLKKVYGHIDACWVAHNGAHFH